MTTKKVEAVFPPPAPHMVGDGFRVHNFIPGYQMLNMQRMSPFIMMDYNSRISFPPKETPRGVGVHPHRGFETVTIAYKGKVAHHDSTGNSGVIGEGDVQWMTAASGVLHKEYHEASFSKTGGDFQMVQLWVNLPADKKMSAPGYQAIAHQEMGLYDLGEGKGKVEIIAGEYKGVKGPAKTFTPVNMMNARIEAGTVVSFNFPENFNTVVLVVEGHAEIDGHDLPLDHLALMANIGEEFTIKAKEPSTVLILSGEPIHEPIVAYGPFVMNTKAEILQAYDDLNKGKFGTLED